MTRFLSIDSEERSASKLIQIIGYIQFLEVGELRSLAPWLLVGSWLGNVLFSTFCFPGPCIRPSRNINIKLDTFGEKVFFSFLVVIWLLCRAKANRALPREHTGHSKHPLPTTQEKTLYTWTSPDGQHWNQVDYILWSQRWRNSIQSAKTRPGGDCGSDHELLIAKFRLKLEKVGKTSRPFRYDLNQTPYDYTVEVTNRLQGLDLVDRVSEDLWMEVHNIVGRHWSKPSPRKRNAIMQNGYLDQ